MRGVQGEPPFPVGHGGGGKGLRAGPPVFFQGQAHPGQEDPESAGAHHHFPVDAVAEDRLEDPVFDGPVGQLVLQRGVLGAGGDHGAEFLEGGGGIPALRHAAGAGDPAGQGGFGEVLVLVVGLEVVIIDVFAGSRLILVGFGEKPPFVRGAHGAPKEGERHLGVGALRCVGDPLIAGFVVAQGVALLVHLPHELVDAVDVVHPGVPHVKVAGGGSQLVGRLDHVRHLFPSEEAQREGLAAEQLQRQFSPEGVKEVHVTLPREDVELEHFLHGVQNLGDELRGPAFEGVLRRGPHVVHEALGYFDGGVHHGVAVAAGVDGGAVLQALQGAGDQEVEDVQGGVVGGASAVGEVGGQEGKPVQAAEF
mmetsp:Transcript_16679/g.37502  ORF Transcript_16679/g.37502 Transcript_16679/m.37502 type:complete len:365 (+) Transcript_16679:7482-8576(+)